MKLKNADQIRPFSTQMQLNRVLQTHKKSLKLLSGFIVEPQRIELWSREDERVRSTCLVDFNCRG